MRLVSLERATAEDSNIQTRSILHIGALCLSYSLNTLEEHRRVQLNSTSEICCVKRAIEKIIHWSQLVWSALVGCLL